ncbi:binding partner of ACD11 1-like isoform X2 [Curcuma longa]|uniref:binding partner of ACD11 1-like isoform X2 n=1 Tax=Curcuma longa TaxID=136217 RepID=UPI003D9F721E
MSVTTVKISNVSPNASVQEIQEFFSFSGEIVYVEMQRGNESSQVAYVTFKDSQGAETALLLTGAKIVDLVIDITPDPDYQLPANVSSNDSSEAVSGIGLVVQKAENVVSTMLAKGFILGKDALNKAQAFDEKHQLRSTASAKVSELDKRIRLREKISKGTTAVNEKVTEMDQKYQVSEKTKSAFAVAEQKVSTAGAALMSNRYVSSSASWVTETFNRVVAKAASNAGSKTMDKAQSDQESDIINNGIESKEVEKVGIEQGSTNVELKTIDKVMNEQESSDVQLKAIDKVLEKEPTEQGSDAQLKAIDKEPEKELQGDFVKVQLSETSNNSSSESQGKPEPAPGLIL